MRGVIYARYSEGPRQTDQSIEGQVADCRAFAERHDIDILEVYADRHISGRSVEGRYEFQRMIRDAQDHKFDAVIVWKIDRFGRDRQDIAINKAVLRRSGVRLMYAQESVPDGPEGIILESVLEGIAEYYSADLRQKVIRGRRETLKKGLYCGQTLPIGFRVDETRHVVIDEKTAPAVRAVFQMYASGHKLKECTAYMNEQGITSRHGGKITDAIIHRMLRNKKYIGIFDVSGIEMRTEPMIDEATFQSCADNMIHSHKLNAAGKASTNFLLSCKCFCGLCGALIVGDSGRSKTGAIYYYYKCGKKKKGGSCQLKPIRKEAFEDLIIKATIEDMLTDETIRFLTDEILRIQEEELKEDPATALKSRIDSCRKKQKNLISAIEETGARGLASRLAALEEEEQELVLEMEKAKIKSPRLSREDIEGWLYSFTRGDKTDESFCKRLLDTFVARIDLTNEVAVIYYNISDKKKQKRTVSLGSNTMRLLGHMKHCPNPGKPFIFEGYIVLITPLRPSA